MTDLFGGALPDPEPQPDPYAGMGHDAKRTAQQQERLAHGLHPVAKRYGAYLPIITTGQTCSDCAHLVRKDLGYGRRYWKCSRQLSNDKSYPIGPDIRLSWPACAEFEARNDGGEEVD